MVIVVTNQLFDPRHVTSLYDGDVLASQWLNLHGIGLFHRDFLDQLRDMAEGIVDLDPDDLANCFPEQTAAIAEIRALHGAWLKAGGGDDLPHMRSRHALVVFRN